MTALSEAEVGHVPDGWEVKAIRDLCDIWSGGTPRKTEPAFWSGDIPWVSGKDLKSPQLDDSIDHISAAGLDAGSRLAPAGAVFVLVRGMGLAKDLPVAVARRSMAFNQDIKALVSRTGLSGSFLRSAIYHAKDRLLSRIVPSAHGTMTLNLDDVEDLSILVPTDLAEAEVVASVLDLVQQAISTEKRHLEGTTDFKRAAMRGLFTRGLRDEAQKETEFGLVPEAWHVLALDHCAKVQTGVAKGRRFADAEMVDVPYLRVANVQDGRLDLTDMKEIHIRRSELERFRLQIGDVVLTEGGDFDKLGRGFIWRGEIGLCVHQNHVFAVRPDRSRLTPEFFAYLAQSAYGRGYFLKVAHKTTNLASINSTKLKAFPVLIPSLDEQREIVAILDAIDRKIDLHKKKRVVLDDLFKALLYKLMTGEIRVADLDLSALAPPAKAEAAE